MQTNKKPLGQATSVPKVARSLAPSTKWAVVLTILRGVLTFLRVILMLIQTSVDSVKVLGRTGWATENFVAVVWVATRSPQAHQGVHALAVRIDWLISAAFLTCPVSVAFLTCPVSEASLTCPVSVASLTCPISAAFQTCPVSVAFLTCPTD